MASKNVVRNAGIVAVAGAAVLGSVAPANAFAHAEIPAQPAVYQSYEAYQTPAQTTPALVSYSYNTQEATQETTSSVSTQATAAEVIADATGARATILEAAYDGIGGSYVWGGKSYKAWDCSGFVSYVYAKAGINLTAYTYAMKNEVKATSNPQPGDIVFTNGYAHVGIYVGNGQMISALNPSQGTQLTSVDGGGFMPVDGYYTAL